MNTERFAGRPDVPVPDATAPRWRRVSHFLKTHVRYEVIAILFALMTINQADRATLSIASAPMSHELGFSHVEIGWLLSAFAWAYMLSQIPGGWLIDRFGAVPTLGAAIFLWSIFAGLVGGATIFGHGAAAPIIFTLVFLVGMAAAPSFPSNSKIVAVWFPTNERATATSIFNSSQYLATALFAPLLAAIGESLGWRAIFLFMGVLGIASGFVFRARVRMPQNSKNVTQQELQVLHDGGALDPKAHEAQVKVARESKVNDSSRLWAVGKLLSNRMMLGIYIGQYCISTLTFFFITWFPIYLVQGRGFSLLQAGLMASVPALCGFVGGLSGGAVSDLLLRRGVSLSIARKLPLCLGMLLSSVIILCNFVKADGLVILFMAISFFGKAMGALGWAIVADVSPAKQAGLNASIFNTFSSAAGITTPIVIGYLVQHMHSFNGALVFVGLHAVAAIICFVFVVGPLKRLEEL